MTDGATSPDRQAVPSPSTDPATAAAPRRGRRWWIAGLAIAALVVIVLGPLSSADPDGLERVAEDAGFLGMAENFFSGLLGDYAIPGVDNAWLSTVLAGLLGLAIVVAAMVILGRVVTRRRA